MRGLMMARLRYLLKTSTMARIKGSPDAFTPMEPHSSLTKNNSILFFKGLRMNTDYQKQIHYIIDL